MAFSITTVVRHSLKSIIRTNQGVAVFRWKPVGIKSVHSQGGVPFTIIPYSRRSTNPHHILSHKEDHCRLSPDSNRRGEF